jgi:DNA repair exonuclease SbcCD ATPase subunit
MYSAGVNAALAAFFGIADIDNILQSSSNTPSTISTIPNTATSNIPKNATSNIPAGSIDVEVLPGKLESGDSAELPKADSEVAEQLQNDLGNLKAENEKLKQGLVDARADYAKLLESSGQTKASREKEISELRSQLEAEKKRSAELEEELDDREKELEQLRSEFSDLKQKSAAASELPEAADLYNQLKAKRKKSGASLADVELILEIIEKS